ncbi:iron-containing redox enzyme family protein [Actinokineospora soli]|uniref:Iron-containing redox enzyme family protein n=1 Tax=Actinokineospora soli TaxID=1048753 RepID=A0ABW2TTK7_9PSEU
MSLPAARGPLSEWVRDVLGGPVRPVDGPRPDGDPFGEDATLALHLCYELHYQGFPGVDPDWEWQPDLLRFRGALEREFLDALKDGTSGGKLDDVLPELLVDESPPRGVSQHLAEHGTWEQVREYFIHRSIYHLKEADPHAWVIPRLRGRAKAALVAVEFDEFGGGRAEDVHAQLYADLLAECGLSTEYLHYLDDVPAPAIATVNMMSLFGLHRSLRSAMCGHFAAAEIGTPPSAARVLVALERLGAGPATRRFFAEHVEADAVHEQIMRHDVVGRIVAEEPDQEPLLVLGIQATGLMEARMGEHLLGCWTEDRSSLRTAISAPGLVPTR